jgi:hypothetical protein
LSAVVAVADRLLLVMQAQAAVAASLPKPCMFLQMQALLSVVAERLAASVVVAHRD